MKHHLLPLAVAAILATVSSSYAATSFGVNFNNNDLAGAQINGNFGATWTNVNTATGTGLAINGTPSTTLHWASSGFYQAGSWTSSTVGNTNGTPIGMMRVYLDDGDALAAGAPASLGATASDGISVSVNLQGMSAWLASEGATAYTIHAYFSTDNGTAFQAISVRDGNTVGSSLLETINPTVQGNGQWDGTLVDTGGNGTGGIRGDALFASQFTQDNITLTVASRNGSSRGTLAGFVITAVPEPSVALLGGLGMLGLLRRRRA